MTVIGLNKITIKKHNIFIYRVLYVFQTTQIQNDILIIVI